MVISHSDQLANCQRSFLGMTIYNQECQFPWIVTLADWHVLKVEAHLHPLRDVCIRYENNPANVLLDIVRKLNLSFDIN